MRYTTNLHEHEGVEVLEPVEDRLCEMRLLPCGGLVLSWREERRGLSNGSSSRILIVVSKAGIAQALAERVLRGVCRRGVVVRGEAKSANEVFLRDFPFPIPLTVQKGNG